MPQKINVFSKKDKPTQQELLKRVTSAKEQIPQAQKPLPPGIEGRPPLPVGKVVGQKVPGEIDPKNLTDISRKTLEAIGWTPDIPIPNSMADILENACKTARSASETPPEYDPATTPKQKAIFHDINALPEEKKTAVLNTMKKAAADNRERIRANREAQKDQIREAATPGIAVASSVAQKAEQSFWANDPVETFVPENETAKKPVKQELSHETSHETPRETPRETPPETVPEAQTVTPAGGVCLHCGWDQSQVDVPEPPHAEKMAFLHTLLGEKPYSKEYKLFDGAVVVCFRTLTPREIDVVYRQAYLDTKNGDIKESVDYYERLNQYRLYLQIVKIYANVEGGFHHTMNDGYSEFTNPHVGSPWFTEEQEAELGSDVTGLKEIERWMMENVFKTEALFRVVNTECNRFNRLVAKLEAMADNSDFWKPTGEQS